MPALVGLAGAILVVAPPQAPGIAVRLVAAGPGDDGAAELPKQLGDSDGDQAEDGGVAVTGALPGGCGGEESAGEQADRGPAVPGGPGGDLAAVQAGDLLVQLVIFLDFPAGDRHGDQLGQRDGPRAPALVVADGAGIAVLAQEQEGMTVVVALGGVVGGDLDHRPVVVLGALGRRSGAHPLPHAGFPQFLRSLHGDATAGGQGDGMVRADGHDVAGAEFPDALAQVKAPVDFVADDEGTRMPRPCACLSSSPASSGLVANMTSSGTPASSRCSSSAAQPAGRYRRSEEHTSELQ